MPDSGATDNPRCPKPSPLKPKCMSATVFRLTELPVETLEQVLLHLPSQGVIKMEVVWCVIAIPHDSALTFRCVIQISRQFQELVSDSPTLQYRRELFSGGLIETSRNPCDFAQCRKLCEEHKYKWSNAGRVVKTIHGLPEKLSLKRHFTRTLGWSLIAYRNKGDGSLSFLRPPPVTSKKPNRGLDVFVAYLPNDLLVVAEESQQ